MYTIVIKQVRNMVKTTGKDWTVVGEKAVFSGSVGSTVREYGYTPEIEKRVAVEREVLKQEVDELDLPAVIRAINGL